MKIGIQPDLIGKESYSEKWSEYFQKNSIDVLFLNLLTQDGMAQASLCDGVMWRWGHNPNDKQSAKNILYTIEHSLNIPVFPNSNTSWHYDEKIAQFYLLKSLHAPVPDTRIFWNKKDTLSWLSNASYPLVFKLSSGAGSSNVLRVNDLLEATKIAQRMFDRGIFPYTENEFADKMQSSHTKKDIKRIIRRLFNAWSYLWKNSYPPLPSSIFWKPEFGYVYFQEFLPENNFDTRITIIGNRAFGFRRMNRPNDFRASGSGILDHDPTRIDPRCIEIAFDISRRTGAQSMAYDFLFAREDVIAK